MKCSIREISLLATLLIFCFSSLQGSLKGELDGFFHKFGSSSNVTSEGVYLGQTAGYATGGGVSIRNNVYNHDLANVSLPRIDAGCGGIDLHTGGFSFISKEQLVKAMKDTASNAASYAFLLGVETVSPQVANTMKQLQSWANTINGIGINSCENGMSLVSAAWPKSEAASQQICRTMGSSSGVFGSYIDGRHGCTASSKQNEVTNRLQGKNKNAIIGPSNLTWEAIRQQKFLASNDELSYLFMTLVGTVITKKDDKGYRVDTYPAKATSEDFLRVLMQGGDTEIYRCSDSKDSKCLTISKDKWKVEEKDSWYGKIKNSLMDMQRKAQNDEPLTAEQKELLNKTRFPLYKMVNVLTAHTHGNPMIDLSHIAEMVSKELLSQYLREVQELVEEGFSHVTNRQIYQNHDEIEAFKKRLIEIDKKIGQLEIRSKDDMEKEFQMMQRIDFLEEKIIAEVWLGGE